MEDAIQETIQARIKKLFADIKKHKSDDGFRSAALSEIVFLRELLVAKPKPPVSKKSH